MQHAFDLIWLQVIGAVTPTANVPTADGCSKRRTLLFSDEENRRTPNRQLAHWRLASLPDTCSQIRVERVVASCNRSKPMGKRDFAILLLLARLGFGQGILPASADDLDWHEASIQVSGKGRRQTRLP